MKKIKTFFFIALVLIIAPCFGQITNVTFSVPPSMSDSIWVLKIEVEGHKFIHRAAPVVAMVGNVNVELLVVNNDGTSFVGLLRAFPPDGAELKVGYLDTKLSNTGFFYHPVDSSILFQNRLDKQKLKRDFITDSVGCLGLRLAYFDTLTSKLTTHVDTLVTHIYFLPVNNLSVRIDTMPFGSHRSTYDLLFETKTKYLIAGIDFMNQKANNIISLLGKPNRIASYNATEHLFLNSIKMIETYWYYLTSCGKNKFGKILVFRVYGDKIIGINIIEY